MRRLLLAALLLAAAAGAARAEGTTASFLKVGVGARPIGMGDAFTAVADDLNAVHWNPGGLARLSSREFAAMDARLFADTRLDFVGYAHPTSRGTLAVSALHLSQGAIEARDADRRRAGTYKAYDSAASVSYAFALGSLGVGGSVKMIQSRIAEASATGFAADVGLHHRGALPGLSLGLAATNVGPGLRFLSETSPLPLTLSAGAAWKGPLGLTLSADLKRRVHERRTAVAVGGEYGAAAGLALRAGYLSGLGDASGGSGSRLESLQGLGAGFGLKLGGFAVDYAFTPAGELGSAQRLSVGIRF